MQQLWRINMSQQGDCRHHLVRLFQLVTKASQHLYLHCPSPHWWLAVSLSCITLKTGCYQPCWKASAWVLLCTLHMIIIFQNTPLTDLIFKKHHKISHVFFHFFPSFIFYFCFNDFLPKIIWVHARDWGVFICGHGHRAKEWHTVGRIGTCNGPKSDVCRAEKWRTGQNTTLECYNNYVHPFQWYAATYQLIPSSSVIRRFAVYIFSLTSYSDVCGDTVIRRDWHSGSFF